LVSDDCVTVSLRIPGDLYEALMDHLFPGDGDEHGAVLLAGLAMHGDQLTLLGRELIVTPEDQFPPGKFGYRQIAPLFVAETGGRAADEQLVYLSAHSHPGASTSIGFSKDDLLAHERLFPHLLDLTAAPVVGGLVFGERAVAGDLWLKDGRRLVLDFARVIGPKLTVLRARPEAHDFEADPRHDRQVRLFGAVGQQKLRRLHVGVVGAGGGGSLIVEQLARLGVGKVTVIDFDRVEHSNLSRIVGASVKDALNRTRKIDVLERLVGDADDNVAFRGIEGDVVDRWVAEELLECDFLFLATDTVRARLVFNALTHQYLIPGVQIGSKIEGDAQGQIEEIYGAVRPVFPPHGCLYCAGLLDPMALQQELRTDEEVQAQDYIGARVAPGEVVDPSVISLNGISASDAVTTMLLAVVELAESGALEHRLYFPRDGSSFRIREAKNVDCLFCSLSSPSIFARGDAASLPLRQSAVFPGSANRRRMGLQRFILRGLSRLRVRLP
jgi:hypothetical protein